jgi:hypothetical protein
VSLATEGGDVWPVPRLPWALFANAFSGVFDGRIVSSSDHLMCQSHLKDGLSRGPQMQTRDGNTRGSGPVLGLEYAPMGGAPREVDSSRT